jgi:hypothetical protein
MRYKSKSILVLAQLQKCELAMGKVIPDIALSPLAVAPMMLP